MKKTLILIAIGIVLLLFSGCYIGSGFQKNSCVCIMGYSVAENGQKITLKIAVTSSVGYIRNISVHRQEGGRLELDCYSAFGGLNGSIGAKDTFTFQLKEDTSSIALYRNADFYENVLIKDEGGVWRRASQLPDGESQTR